MRITEVNPEAVDPIEATLLDDFSEVKILTVEANITKIHIKVNTKVTIIKAITAKAVVVYTTTHVEAIIRVIFMANLEAEAMVMVEAINVDMAMTDLIIEVITTTNTMSIMVMMMTTSLTNMAHHCALCGGYNHSPKHYFKGEHDINDIMEKINISGHQSQQSGLYS